MVTNTFSRLPKKSSIKKIQFGKFSSDEIRCISVVEINRKELRESDQTPVEHGLLDPKLGCVQDRGSIRKCGTCVNIISLNNNNEVDCPGHFGHIELARKVYDVSYLPFLINILRCVCHNCGSLLIERDYDETDDEATKLRIKNNIKKLENLKNSNYIEGMRTAKILEMCKSNGDICLKRDRNNSMNKLVYSCQHLQRYYKKGDLFIYYQELVDAFNINGNGEVTNNNIEIDKSTKFQLSESKLLHPEEAYRIVSKISPEDILLLGFDPIYAPPINGIWSAILVIPPCDRPSVSSKSGLAGEDDLTIRLQRIVAINEEFKEAIKENNTVYTSHLELDHLTYLHQVIAEYIKPLEIKSKFPIHLLPKKSKGLFGKNLASCLSIRWKGKQGRMRGNLQGKRVDFAGRTVITPDPNIDIDQVVVPRSMAMNLTYPEKVTDFNIHILQNLVKNGPNVYPGANSILTSAGVEISLKVLIEKNNISTPFKLNKGDEVRRHLVDDDIVLFNRQPTLAKLGMLAHRVRVMPYSTFRLQESITSPYNADFDGDEMNLHVPQGALQRAEALELMRVGKSCIHPKSNAPSFGLVQDSLLSLSEMTKRNEFLDREEFFSSLYEIENTWRLNIKSSDLLEYEKEDLLKVINDKNKLKDWIPTPAILKPKSLWTGKQVISTILSYLPKISFYGYCEDHSNQDDKIKSLDFNNKYEHLNEKNQMLSKCYPNDNFVTIHNGELLTGVLDSKLIAKGSCNLIQIVLNDYGYLALIKFIGSLKNVATTWMLKRGFSVGISDVIASSNIMKQVEKILDESYKKNREIDDKYMKGKIERVPGKTLQETYEIEKNSMLNRARDEAGSVVINNISSKNRIAAMKLAGSKGSNLNLSQIIALVGQQNVEGKRIACGFKGRTLPHYTKGNQSAEAKGFVSNSYLSGLTPSEFYFHTMGGREGVIDTAVKTAETGYIQRKLARGTEDIRPQYNGLVTDEKGNVIQFLFGDENMDPTLIEKDKLDIHLLSRKDFDKKFQHPSISYNENDSDLLLNDLSYFQTFLDQRIIRKMNSDLRFNENNKKALIMEYKLLIELRAKFLKDYCNPLNKNFFTNSFMTTPFNIKRLINESKYLYPENQQYYKSDISPLKLFNIINQFIKNRLIIVRSQGQNDKVAEEQQKYAIEKMEMNIRYKLSTKNVLNKYRMSLNQLNYVLDKIERKVQKAIISPGESVGTIAAQSFGEPATQVNY